MFSIVLYFGYYPLIINATFTNVLLLIIISLFLFLLLYFIFINKNIKDLLWILPASILFVFVARAIPNLLLMNPPLHDSYYYYVTTLNVIQYGTLNPVLKSWYPEIVQQLKWPALSLFTSFLSHSTNIDSFNISKFVVPFLGILYFGIIFILAKTVSNDNRLSFLTALIASTNNAVIYYQSEFHPQALASLILILMFFFYFRFKQSENHNIIYGILMISMVFVFITCHHFSSIFIALIAILYILFILSLKVLKNRKKQYESLYLDLSKDFNLWILIGVSIIAYHIFIYFGFISALVLPLTENSPDFTLLMAGSTVPLYVTICNATKYILLLLTIPAMYLILKNPNKYLKEFRFIAFFICFLEAGLISSIFINIPIDRIIYYALPFLAFLTSFTAIKLYDSSFKNLFNMKKLNSKGIRIFIVIILTIPMVGGFFGAQTPSYYFKEADTNAYYWYSNDPTIVNRFASVGNWLQDYSDKKKYYATEFDTRSLVFYFAKVNRLSYYQKGIPESFKGYVVVSPNLPHEYIDFNKTEYLDRIDLYYDDGKIIVGGKT